MQKTTISTENRQGLRWLRHFFDCLVPTATTGGAPIDFSVYELLEFAVGVKTNPIVEIDEVNRTLAGIGVKVDFERSTFLVASNSPAIKRMFKGTRMVNAKYSRFLSSLKGTRLAGTTYFNKALTARAVEIPVFIGQTYQSEIPLLDDDDDIFFDPSNFKSNMLILIEAIRKECDKAEKFLNSNF